MCDIDQKAADLVHQINNRFDELKLLSNDELRYLIYNIQDEISQIDDKMSVLDNFLIEVYAIVKETARRFSCGDIEVTANRNDRLLAEKYDFILIEGDKAIYKNHWNAGEVEFIWNMVHYDEQLLGGIFLHYGKAIEMATGEGKTLVATLPVFLNALAKEGVHVMTVNDYLSKRDYQLTRPLYMLYGFSVGCIEFYEKTEIGRKEVYKADITFGKNSSFVFDYLFDNLAVDPKDCIQGKHNFAIIDEIDSILIDEADTPHVVAGGMPYNDGEIYKKYLPIINELIAIENESLYVIDKLNFKAEYTKEGKKWLSLKLNNKHLFRYSKTYQINNFESLSAQEKKHILENLRIKNVLEQLLKAFTLYERDVDYIVVSGEVKIIDQNTGRIKENSRWEHGLHTAIEVKENVNVKDDSDGLAVISLKNYFRLYSKVCGMSGTILPIKDELLDVYNLESSIIPTHSPLIRIDNPLRIFKTSGAKDNAIIRDVISNCKKGRPTLLGTLSLKRADILEKLLIDNDLKFNRLDARNTKDEAITVAKAGIRNTITLSTSVAGRGTDIKPSEDALNNGGLYVIGADLFGSARTVLQLKGRAGRQGNPGSSTFYASLEDTILGYLPKNKRSELFALTEGIDEDEISTDEIRDFFELAQLQRELNSRNKRIETAKKDDIVAPFRSIFYEKRKQLLLDSNYACFLVNQIISEIHPKLIEQSEKLIQSLYKNSRVLAKRSRRNNVNRKKILIPFTENLHPYTVLLDVDLMLTSEKYFIREFKRQNLLQIYDKLWKDFVLYIMGDLDQKEIEQLSNRYYKLMDSINSIICKRMIESHPTFDCDTLEHSETTIIRKLPNKGAYHNARLSHIFPENKCPCGSGLQYSKCHGKYSNQIRRRR